MKTTQPSLFAAPNAYGADVSPTLPQAIEQRDEALAKVEAHAEADVPDFMERAKAFVLEYLKRGSASSEDVTDASIAAGIAPKESRAFGPVFMALKREKKIVCVGTAPRRKGHGTIGNVWGLAANGSPA